MNFKVWYTKSRRKLHSFWVNYVLEILPSKKITHKYNNGLSLIGHVDVLEVFVPLLVTNENAFEIDSPELIEDLRLWMNDMSLSWGASRLQFKVAEPLVHKGWDAVTGLKGRVVSLEVWGVRQGLETLQDALWSNLAELSRSDNEKRSEELVAKVKELMLEKSKRTGNVKNVFDLTP